jgi:hypothetical protein
MANLCSFIAIKEREVHRVFERRVRKEVKLGSPKFDHYRLWKAHMFMYSISISEYS